MQIGSVRERNSAKMPTKSLRCLVEIDIRAVTSPGTWLSNREDVYLAVSLFGQRRRTRLSSAIFPLLFHDTLRFDKVFYTAYEPAQLADCLEDMMVKIELIQMSDLLTDGRILAWYQSSAREFLYPEPTYSPIYGIHDREILLERSVTFPGIMPRLEFSSKTIIQDAMIPLDPWLLDDGIECCNSGSSLRRSRSRSRSISRSRSPSRSPTHLSGYVRPTVSSMYRSRSVSPLRNQLRDLSTEDSSPSALDDRPPFVVRKVDEELIGRKPTPTLSRGRSLERKRRKSFTQSSYDDTGYGSRSASPTRFGSSLQDRYWSPSRADLIQARVDLALQRNRSLERLKLNRSLERIDRINRYRSYRLWPYYYPYYYDTLDDLELDLELARRGIYI